MTVCHQKYLQYSCIQEFSSSFILPVLPVHVACAEYSVYMVLGGSAGVIAGGRGSSSRLCFWVCESVNGMRVLWIKTFIEMQTMYSIKNRLEYNYCKGRSLFTLRTCPGCCPSSLSDHCSDITVRSLF